MKTIRMSCSHALFKYLIAQKTIIDEKDKTIERLQGTVTRLMRENMGLNNNH